MILVTLIIYYIIMVLLVEVQVRLLLEVVIPQSHQVFLEEYQQTQLEYQYKIQVLDLLTKTDHHIMHSAIL